MTGHPSRREQDEVVLVTRIKTVNKGNQALSAAWLAMLERSFPDARVRLLERRPRHLIQHTLREVAAHPDPVAHFDAIARALAALAPGPGLVGPAQAPGPILLDEAVTPPARFLELRQRLNLRGQLARFGRYAADYRRRLSAFQRARLVVINPAGEFFPREPQAAFYHLLDAHVAQKLGCPTAIVNHTMDITDPTLRRIIPMVYRTLALVGFRDEKSVGAFTAMGGDLANVLVTPDLALTEHVRPTGSHRDRTVALAINVPEAAAHRYLDAWFEVITGLRAAGLEVVLVSNELPVDLYFYERVMARFPGLRIEGARLDHDKYAELLGTFDVVVTSRMHTGILAMAAGTPVVPVEGSSFKITGLFQELGFSAPVIRPLTDRWTAQVVERVVSVRASRAAASHEVNAKLGAVRERIIAQLVPALRQLADASARQARPA